MKKGLILMCVSLMVCSLTACSGSTVIENKENNENKTTEIEEVFSDTAVNEDINTEETDIRVETFDEGTVLERDVYYYDYELHDEAGEMRGQFCMYQAKFKDARLQPLNDWYQDEYEKFVIRLEEDKRLMQEGIESGYLEDWGYYWDHFCAPMIYEKDGIVSVLNNWAYHVGEDISKYGEGTYSFNYDYINQKVVSLSDILGMSEEDTREYVEERFGSFTDEDYEIYTWTMDERGIYFCLKDHVRGGIDELLKRWDERTAEEKYLPNGILADGSYSAVNTPYDENEPALENISVYDDSISFEGYIRADSDIYADRFFMDEVSVPLSDSATYKLCLGEGEESEDRLLTKEEFIGEFYSRMGETWMDLLFDVKDGAIVKITINAMG